MNIISNNWQPKLEGVSEQQLNNPICDIVRRLSPLP